MTAARILLVEGVPGIGKSTLVNGLEARYTAEAHGRSRSFLRLGQAHTHWPATRGGTAAACACIAGVLQTVEGMAAAVLEEREPYFWCLIDTLHLTLAERPGGLTAREVGECGERLARLGARLVVLTAREETLRRRCIEGREGNPWLTGMLARHGGHDAMVAALMGEQQRMTAGAERQGMVLASFEAERPVSDIVEAAWKVWMG